MERYFKITKPGTRQVLLRCDLGHDQQVRCIDTVELASTAMPGHHQGFRLCTGGRSWSQHARHLPAHASEKQAVDAAVQPVRRRDFKINSSTPDMEVALVTVVTRDASAGPVDGTAWMAWMSTGWRS